jgi:hypothetical protein
MLSQEQKDEIAAHQKAHIERTSKVVTPVEADSPTSPSAHHVIRHATRHEVLPTR